MFHTDLDLRALKHPGQWVVDSPLIWDDGGFRVTVPVGMVTDLASVPRLFQNILNINGYARRPAVLHDWLYRTACDDFGEELSRAECDHLFRKALQSEGAGFFETHTYWLGVRTGGWLAWGTYRKLEH